MLYFVNRSVSPAGRISTSPIRPVKSPSPIRKPHVVTTAGADVLPPWKQEGYSATMESQMKETRVTTSTTQVTEERWEGRYGVQEQVTVTGAAAGEVATGAREVKSVFGKNIGFSLCGVSPLLDRSAKWNLRGCVKICAHLLLREFCCRYGNASLQHPVSVLVLCF